MFLAGNLGTIILIGDYYHPFCWAGGVRWGKGFGASWDCGALQGDIHSISWHSNGKSLFYVGNYIFKLWLFSIAMFVCRSVCYFSQVFEKPLWHFIVLVVLIEIPKHKRNLIPSMYTRILGHSSNDSFLALGVVKKIVPCYRKAI